MSNVLRAILSRLYMLRSHELLMLAIRVDAMLGGALHYAGQMHAARQIDTYLIPALEAKNELNGRATFAAGLIMSGGGDRMKEQLRITADDVGAQMAHVITSYAAARGAGLNVPTPDLSRAQILFQTMTEFIEGKTDIDDLRNLIVSWNGIYIEHQTVARQISPGRDTDVSLHLTRLAKSAKTKGKNWRDASMKVYYGLEALIESGRASALDHQAFDRMNEWSDLESSLKKLYHAHKKKLSVTN